jgi:hypothetical protein
MGRVGKQLMERAFWLAVLCDGYTTRGKEVPTHLRVQASHALLEWLSASEERGMING